MESITITKRGCQFLVNTSKDKDGRGKSAISAAEAAAIAVQKSHLFESFAIIGCAEAMQHIPEKLRSK